MAVNPNWAGGAQATHFVRLTNANSGAVATQATVQLLASGVDSGRRIGNVTAIFAPVDGGQPGAGGAASHYTSGSPEGIIHFFLSSDGGANRNFFYSQQLVSPNPANASSSAPRNFIYSMTTAVPVNTIAPLNGLVLAGTSAQLYVSVSINMELNVFAQSAVF